MTELELRRITLSHLFARWLAFRTEAALMDWLVDAPWPRMLEHRIRLEQNHIQLLKERAQDVP